MRPNVPGARYSISTRDIRRRLRRWERMRSNEGIQNGHWSTLKPARLTAPTDLNLLMVLGAARKAAGDDDGEFEVIQWASWLSTLGSLPRCCRRAPWFERRGDPDQARTAYLQGPWKMHHPNGRCSSVPSFSMLAHSSMPTPEHCMSSSARKCRVRPRAGSNRVDGRKPPRFARDVHRHTNPAHNNCTFQDCPQSRSSIARSFRSWTNWRRIFQLVRKELFAMS